MIKDSEVYILERYYSIVAIYNEEKYCTELLFSETDNKIVKHMFSEEFQKNIIANNSLKFWYHWNDTFMKYQYLIDKIKSEGLLCLQDSKSLYEIADFVYNYIYDSLISSELEYGSDEELKKYKYSKEELLWFAYRMHLICHFFMRNFESRFNERAGINTYIFKDISIIHTEI